MFFKPRFVLPVIALVWVLCVLAACGGGTAGSFNDVLDTPDNSFVGITDGDFKAVRFNEAGYRDAALNSTIGFTTRRSGDFTEVTISVDDTYQMNGVTMHLEFDPNRYHPVGNEFLGLINDPIEAYIPLDGVVALGQVNIEQTARSGNFATVRFADGPSLGLKTMSAVHASLINDEYGAGTPLDPSNYNVGFSVSASGDDFVVMASSQFAQGDGDDNGETNITDITPLVLNFNETVSDTNFGPAASDYDRNSEVNLTDITQIVLNYGATVHHIDFMIADSADMAGATVHEAVVFADGASTSRTPSPFSATTWNEVWRNWTSTITAADIAAADLNEDTEVFVSARTSDGTVNGEMFPGTLIVGIPETGIEVLGIDVEMDGTPVAGGSTVDLIANGTYNFDIVGISGNYDPGTGPIPFDSSDAGGLVPQDLYDTQLGLAQGTATWSVTTLPFDPTGFKATGDCLALDTTSGASVIGIAFPDWDPESVAPDTEGTLNIDNTGAPTFTLNLDVDEDLTAPAIDSFGLMTDVGQDGEGNWLLNTAGETFVTGEVIWGTVPPVDQANVTAQLFNFGNPTGHVGLAYTTDNPPGVGMFTLDGTLFSATVAPVSTGEMYGLRVTNGEAGTYSSVNIPGVWFTTGSTGTPVTFVTAPMGNQLGTGDGFLQIMYPDPQIRRVPDVTWNDISRTFDGTDDIGYNDFIKVQGDNGEFNLAYHDVDPDRLPRVIVIEGTIGEIGPATISESALVPDGMNPNKMVLDIATLGGGNFGELPKEYAFKLYDKFDNEMGSGTFEIAPMPIAAPGPTGLQWGINVFDILGRGMADYAISDWSYQILQADSVGTGTPDVMFVEFTDGTVSNWPATLGNGNMEIVFRDAGGATMNVPVDIRAVGLGAGINLIAIHEFVDSDFFSIANPDGLLKTNESYFIDLEDPNTADSPDYTFADLMIVVN